MFIYKRRHFNFPYRLSSVNRMNPTHKTNWENKSTLIFSSQKLFFFRITHTHTHSQAQIITTKRMKLAYMIGSFCSRYYKQKKIMNCNWYLYKTRIYFRFVYKNYCRYTSYDSHEIRKWKSEMKLLKYFNETVRLRILSCEHR